MSTDLGKPLNLTLGEHTLLRAVPAARAGVECFLARDGLGRDVVVSVLERSKLGADGTLGVRVAQAKLDRVKDPRVAPLWGRGEARLRDRDVLFSASPWGRGVTLADWLGRKGLDPQPGEVAALALAMAEALAAAHGEGLSHGDVSAACVLLGPGRALVVGDFGYSPWPLMVEGASRSLPAPELRLGGPATPAGDVFAWGMCVAAAWCGLEALSRWRVLAPGDEAKVVEEALVAKSGLPAEVVRLVGQALGAAPATRPAAAALVAQVRPLAGELPLVDGAAESGPSAPAGGLAVLDEKTEPGVGGEAPPALEPEPKDPVPGPQELAGGSMEAAPASREAVAEVEPAVAPAQVASPVEASLDEGSQAQAGVLEGAAALVEPPPGVTPARLTEPEEPELVEEVAEVGEEASVGVPDDAPLPQAQVQVEEEVSARAAPPPLPPPSLPPPGVAPPAILPPLDLSPVVINLKVPGLPLPSGEDFPVVARWTDRPAPRAPAAQAAPPPKPAAPERARSSVLGMAGGFVAGMLVAAGFSWLMAGTPERGSLRVVTPMEDRDVMVAVDGREVGRAPVEVRDLDHGAHVVVFKAAELEPAVLPVLVEGGRETVVSGAPLIRPSRLVVTASTLDARATVGDQDPQSLPAEFEDLIPESDVELTVWLAGQVVRRSIRIPPGEMRWHVELPRGEGGKGKALPPPPPPPPPGPPAAVETPPPPAAAPRPVAPGKKAMQHKAQESVQAGNRALLLGKFDEAERAMRSALEQDPGSTEALRALGIILARQGKPCEALRSYRRYLDTSAPGPTEIDRIKGIMRDLQTKNPSCK
jgi:hypothetical protein